MTITGCMKGLCSAFARKGDQAAIICRDNQAPAHRKHWQGKRARKALAAQYIAIRWIKRDKLRQAGANEKPAPCQ